MFYSNKLKTKKYKEKTVLFDSFQTNLNTDENANILDENQTNLSYNFSTNFGFLQCGYGFSELSLPQTIGATTTRDIEFYKSAQILGIWHFRLHNSEGKKDERLIWFNNDGTFSYCSVFSYDPSSYQIFLDHDLPHKPVGLNLTIDDTNIMFFSFTDGYVKITSSQKIMDIESPHSKIERMCRAYDGIYIITEYEPQKIYYSEAINDLADWISVSNSITLDDERGDCQQLVNFNDYLYVFREYGITKISKYTTKGDYSITNLFLTTAKIYPDTVVKCGDSIIFMAMDGLYNFNGNSTKKYDFNITKLLDGTYNEKATACYLDGKYFVACRMNFDDGEIVGCESCESGFTNNALLVLDTETNNLSVMRGVDISSLLSLNSSSVSTVLACFNGQYCTKIGMLNTSGQVFGEFLPSYWRSVISDLDMPEKNKIIKDVFIKADDACMLTIKTDKEEKSFSVAGGRSTQKIRVNTKGKCFQAIIKSNIANKIDSLKINILVEDE